MDLMNKSSVTHMLVYMFKCKQRGIGIRDGGSYTSYALFEVGEYRK